MPIEHPWKKANNRISIDFDGVIHRYSLGYKDGSIYDSPMDGAVENIRKLHNKGYKLVICTARVDHEEIEEWLSNFDIDDVFEDISNIKYPSRAYIDDRAIRFTNWQDIQKYF